jgi:hypothetical protein
MSAELLDRNIIYDQVTDRGKTADESIWLNAGHNSVLIISVYDAAKVLAKTVAAKEITTEPVPGITLTLHRFNAVKTPEVPEQTGPRLDAVVKVMRRSGSGHSKPRWSAAGTHPKTNRQ